MNPISIPVAQSIVLCYNNIKNSKVITTQTFDDSYNVDNVIVNRQITISSKPCKGDVVTIFRLAEAYPDRTVQRVCLTGIDAVLLENDRLAISSDAYMAVIDVAPAVPEPAPAPEQPQTL